METPRCYLMPSPPAPIVNRAHNDWGRPSILVRGNKSALPTLLWRQPKLLRGGRDPISLLLVVSKYIESTPERPFRELGFAEHHARPDQFDPSVRVAR